MDDRARPRRGARLERHDHVCRGLLSRPAPVGTSAALFAAHGQLALLARDTGDRLLRGVDVGCGDHAGTDVARIWRRRLPRLQLFRDRRGDAPVVSEPRVGVRGWFFWGGAVGVGGIRQGLFGGEYGAGGYLVYSFAETVAAMHPM